MFAHSGFILLVYKRIHFKATDNYANTNIIVSVTGVHTFSKCFPQ